MDDKLEALDEPWKTLAKGLIASRRTNQGTWVIRCADLLSEALEEVITRKLDRDPPASGRRTCPKQFKVRISVARDLGIITADQHLELVKIRDMRNIFARSGSGLNLEEGEMNRLFKELKPRGPDSEAYAEAFLDCVIDIKQHLRSYAQLNFPD